MPAMPRRRVLFLGMMLGMVLSAGACRFIDGEPVDPALQLGIGAHLVAQVDVIDQIESIDVEERTYTGLRLRIGKIYWRGDPPGWIVGPPTVAEGDMVEALAFPKYDYAVGGDYVASLSYGAPAFGYQWDLGTGVDSSGNVITNRDPQKLRDWLAAADSSDGDHDPPGVLLGALAEELETRRKAEFEGVPYDELPFGPLLAAIYVAEGLEERLTPSRGADSP